MKLNKILSIFAMAVAPMLAAVSTTGCTGEDASAQTDDVTALSDYTADIDRLNEQYPDEIPIQKLSDAWTAYVKIADKTIPAPTHLFGDVVNIIPYSNDDNVTDANGEDFARGDMVISKYYKPHKLGFALKMHRPEKRIVDLNNSDAANMKEDFKLQDTHLGAVVGVEKAEHGQPGAITLNNPQTYEGGKWGNPTYSMIFLEPVFPGWAQDHQSQYIDNVRSMMLGFNAATNFPGDYNGGDPLGAHNPEKLRTYVGHMVRAVTGDQESQDWFKKDENMVYCAEMVFMSWSAGLIVPMNKANIEPLVGAEVWQKFAKEVEKHNEGVDEFVATGEVSDPSAFVKMNGNKRSALVRITLAPDDLPPMAELSPNPEHARKLMALTPMTMADIVQQFMRTHIPRQLLGEELAGAQAAVLQKMKPGLLESMGLDRVPDDHPSRLAVDALFAEIVETVGKQYGSYEEFREALEPLMAKARQVTGPRPGDESGPGLFVPPSLFHVAAQGEFHGLIGVQYVGHGVHTSNVVKRADAAPEPEPVEEPSLSCAHDPCVEGEPLTVDNCNLPAVTAQTTADPYCKSTSWDSICVADAKAAGICSE